ncbi:MAG TPA: ATP-binding cassette domain-containing protein [Candidatus Paceibacterota bacterium]
MDNQRKKRIIVESASKRFNIGYKGGESVLARIVNIFSGKEQKRELVAANNVSIEVFEGEVIGVIGRNGSGKSTLLRLIAGIYKPSTGLIDVRGDIMYLHGSNHGIRFRLTMRENIFLACSVMGLKKDEVAEEFDDIVDFAGLNEFVDTKVYQFSSGMVSRLSFSIFVHCVGKRLPDVIILDEVLSAGGDLNFRDKVLSKIQELLERKATVFIASHQLNDIEKYCSRALWIEKGALKEDGRPADVINKYKSFCKIN